MTTILFKISKQKSLNYVFLFNSLQTESKNYREKTLNKIIMWKCFHHFPSCCPHSTLSFMHYSQKKRIAYSQKEKKKDPFKKKKNSWKLSINKHSNISEFIVMVSISDSSKLILKV